MIKLDGISFAYDDNLIIDDLSAEIKKGECVFITGDNGTGKSTLIKILNGLIFPDSGEYVFDGENINEKMMKNSLFSKKFHSKIGYVFQNTDSQLFCSNVYDEIIFSLRQTDMEEDEIKRRADDMINMFSLDKFISRAPYTLSAGEKKRVALASVLITSPKVIMLDEPLASLDKKTGEFLTSTLISLKNAGKTIIAVSHNDELKNTLCDTEITLSAE